MINALTARLIWMHFCTQLFAAAGFMLSIRLFPQGGTVLFYRGLLLIVIWTLSVGVSIAAIRYFRSVAWLTWKDVAMGMSFFVAINLTSFVLFPVTFERSISMFLINDILSHDAFVEKSEMEEGFINQYVHERDAIGKRIHEFDVSGIIEHDKDGVRLSKRGKRIRRVLDILRWSYCANGVCK